MTFVAREEGLLLTDLFSENCQQFLRLQWKEQRASLSMAEVQQGICQGDVLTRWGAITARSDCSCGRANEARFS